MASETISKTSKQVFEELYKRELTPQEVYECEHNLFGFFALLEKIDRRNKKNIKRA
jgi:hypothetical protein